MKAVLLDFNGTLFFDSGFHLEAWGKIYRELCENTDNEPGSSFYCGPRNDEIIQKMAPWLTPEERDIYSQKKEALYRQICLQNADKVHLVSGAERLLGELKERQVPFILASASIQENIEFYFRQFGLNRWFDQKQCVYDDGSYADKGKMHVEAAKRLGVTLSKCIVVEDSLSAISHAKSNGAGMIVGVGTDSVKNDLIHAGAGYVIRDFTEFRMEWLDIEIPN
ncbi:MAG: HAD family phosphatase [Lachnospiraceae bacterium]|nr:HAD family phosphatase [Lachnospiraceae bacterium]